MVSDTVLYNETTLYEFNSLRRVSLSFYCLAVVFTNPLYPYDHAGQSDQHTERYSEKQLPGNERRGQNDRRQSRRHDNFFLFQDLDGTGFIGDDCSKKVNHDADETNQHRHIYSADDVVGGDDEKCGKNGGHD